MYNKTVEVSIVIPAFNEERRIQNVLNRINKDNREVIVIDDGSTDRTAEVARSCGALVMTNESRMGYIASIKKGFQIASGDIVVTMDADGEHDPADIDRIVHPILSENMDLVLGVRERITRPSERVINWLVNLKVKTTDCGTGMRAIRSELARSMRIDGGCTCGTFVLEVHEKGANITDVPIHLKRIDKKRKIAWGHLSQMLLVIRQLLRSR